VNLYKKRHKWLSFQKKLIDLQRGEAGLNEGLVGEYRGEAGLKDGDWGV
jgi:hypothetical protein